MLMSENVAIWNRYCD